MISDAEVMLKICGTGSYLHIGCGQGHLVLELLKRSVDAYGMDASVQQINQLEQYAPGRFITGTLAQHTFNQAFDTIVIGPEIFNFKHDQFASAFNLLLSLTKRNLILYFPNNIINSSVTQGNNTSRLFYEKMAIQAGYRLHPRRMLATPYHTLENENLGRITFFERISDEALKEFSIDWLLVNRDLHMDMLRETGKRSDGHVSRYVLAASKVRPGDVVLDAACGLGYGTAVLAALSPGAKFIGVDIDPTSVAYADVNYAKQNPAIEYHASDVTTMPFLPTHSVDIVVSFETIEHVEDYHLFLKEIKRVLKPDGRFIGCVPNLWCDETGKDPNPYHFHVFDWNKLNSAISQYFIVDERYAQTAGGGYKLWDKKREMYRVPFNYTQAVETEWWIISACANPFVANETYSNPLHRNKETAIPAVVDFGKYYDNPWLYRTMVQLGERIADPNILINFCLDIAKNAKPGSAERGAALCVLGYQVLETGRIRTDELNGLITSINNYCEYYDANNLHAYRWAISLHYVAARLLLLHGNRSDALTTFITCAEKDPLKFSPLLATKTISSRMYAGLILAGDHKIAEAREQFLLGVKEAKRALSSNWDNIIGTDEDPLTFGLQETAEVSDLASQCVQALKAIDRQNSVPGYFWDRINLRRFGIVEWTKSVEQENERLRAHARVTAPVAVAAD